MIIKNFAILASDTARTKSYLQMMTKENLLPDICLVYTDDIQKMEKEADVYSEVIRNDAYFNLDEPILCTIRKSGMKYVVVNNKDINSEEIVDTIKQLDQKYLVYSGYGGYILRKPLFQLGKKYIHVHAGILPQYRGSTTAYYSLIQEDYIGATAIFLNEGIDEGEIIYQEKFKAPEKGVNIDVLYEPFIRSQVLKTVMRAYLEDGILKEIEQSTDDVQTYFIIHPVLKHIALMGLK